MTVDTQADSRQALLDELSGIDELALAILCELGEAPLSGGMSLPRLGKRLGQGASVLLRQLTAMSAATVAGVPGPGWVQVARDEERWLAFITEAGRSQRDRWLAVLARAQAMQADINGAPALAERAP